MSMVIKVRDKAGGLKDMRGRRRVVVRGVSAKNETIDPKTLYWVTRKGVPDGLATRERLLDRIEP